MNTPHSLTAPPIPKRTVKVDPLCNLSAGNRQKHGAAAGVTGALEVCERESRLNDVFRLHKEQLVRLKLLRETGRECRVPLKLMAPQYRRTWRKIPIPCHAATAVSMYE